MWALTHPGTRPPLSRGAGSVVSVLPGSTLAAMTDENPATAAQDGPQAPDTTQAAPPPPDPGPGPENDVQAPAEEIALLNENPTAPWPYTGDNVTQDTEQPTELFGIPSAPRTREQQFAFLRAAAAGPPVWHQECLSLTRQAPGLPGGVASAHAAQLMVEPRNRILRVRDLRRGMAGFFDNPDDDNPDGHVATVAGFITAEPTDDLHDVLFISNDVPDDAGEVGYVRGSFFPANWGVPLVYGATTLNGFYLPGYAPTPGPSYRQTLDDAITAVRRGIVTQRGRGHTRKVAALVRDLRVLQAARSLQR